MAESNKKLNFLPVLNIPVLGLTATAAHKVVEMVSETMGLFDKFNII